MEASPTIIAKFYATIKTSFRHVIIYDGSSCTWDRRYVTSAPGCTNRSYEYLCDKVHIPLLVNISSQSTACNILFPKRKLLKPQYLEEPPYTRCHSQEGINLEFFYPLCID